MEKEPASAWLIRPPSASNIKQGVDGGEHAAGCNNTWDAVSSCSFISPRMKQWSAQKPVDVFHLLPSVRPL